jgi:biotin operon repressor
MTSRTIQMQQRYGMEVSDRTIRSIWAAVTKTPQASCREIAASLGIGFSTVATAIRFLHDCGYVEIEHGQSRGRRVVVPFYSIPSEGGRQ